MNNIKRTDIIERIKYAENIKSVLNGFLGEFVNSIVSVAGGTFVGTHNAKQFQNTHG